MLRTRFTMRSTPQLAALLLSLGLAATSTLSAQQMIGPVTLEAGGLPIQVRPTLTMERLQNGSVRVTLSSFNAIPDRNTGILVNGKRYTALSFNTALAQYFNAVRVTGLSATIEFSGVGGCSRATDAEWSEGESVTLIGCGTAPGTPKLERYTISRLSTDGVGALQQRVRELIAEEQRAVAQRAQQAREDSIARARQASQGTQSAPSGSTASGATGAAGTGGATAASPSTPTSATPNATTTPSTSGSTTASAPATARTPAPQTTTAEDYRQSVAEREAAIDAAGAGLEAAATGFLGALAENRRIDEARRQREYAAAVARDKALSEYIARMRVQYNNSPPAPRCTTADRRVLRFGESTNGALNISDCRDAEGRALDEYVVRVPERTLLEFTLSATGTYADGVLETPDGRVVRAGQKVMVEPGDYRVAVRTRYAGERGTYSVKAATTLRSQFSSARVVITGSMDAGQTTVNALEPETGVALAFSAYARVWKGLMLGGTGAGTFYSTAGTNATEFDLGARWYLGNDFWLFRPFVGAGYGRVSYTDADVDEFTGTGPVAHAGIVHSLASLGHGAGIEYSVQYTAPTTLEYNGQPLDFSNVRFRIGLTAAFPKVWY